MGAAGLLHVAQRVGGDLAIARSLVGRFDKVLKYAPAALAIARHTRNQRGEVLRRCHLARAIAAVGGRTEAEEHFLRAAELARATDDRHGEAWALDYLGTALAQAGRPGAATVSWQRAAALFDSLRDPQATSLRSRLAALTEHG